MIIHKIVKVTQGPLDTIRFKHSPEVEASRRVASGLVLSGERFFSRVCFEVLERGLSSDGEGLHEGFMRR